MPTDKIVEIHFYGAGCSTESGCALVSKGLVKVFPKAAIQVEHDLLAAARATCGSDAGIIGILGTGSNSCLYDGKTIIDNIPALGYALGDEGGAAYFGKELIRRYLYREFPEDIHEQFQSTFLLSREIILDNIYNKKTPNTYLANFALFLSLTKKHAYIQELISDGFDEFFTHHITKYKDYRSYRMHFVGAIAYHFKDLLEVCAEKYKCKVGTIIGMPINELVEFHGKA